MSQTCLYERYQFLLDQLLLNVKLKPMSHTLKEKQTYEDYLKTPMAMLLKKFANENKLGKVFIAPLDIYLGENETYQPDVFFISKERESIIGEKKIEGAPDLVIEVLSESTAYYDLKKKKAVYEKSGVSEYWIVDPEEKNIEIYENSTSGFQKIALVESSKTYTSKKLTGFILKSEEVFN